MYVNQRNYVTSLTHYAALFADAAFSDVDISRVNRQTIDRHSLRLAKFAESLQRSGLANEEKTREVRSWTNLIRRHIRDYVLVAATKPS